MSGGSWVDDLLDLLCKIYQLFGGDCSDFDGDPHKAVSQLVLAYSNQGAPKFPTPGDQAKFLALLDELETHLTLQENSLSASDNIALDALITDLRKDLA
jgi:hypothetical protein